MHESIMTADLRDGMIPLGKCDIKKERVGVGLTQSDEKRMTSIETKTGDLDGRVHGVEHRLGQMHAKLLDDESGKGQITILGDKIDSLSKIVEKGFSAAAERDRVRDKEMNRIDTEVKKNSKDIQGFFNKKRARNKLYAGIAAAVAVSLLSVMFLNGFKLMAMGMTEAIVNTVITETEEVNEDS